MIVLKKLNCFYKRASKVVNKGKKGIEESGLYQRAWDSNRIARFFAVHNQVIYRLPPFFPKEPYFGALRRRRLRWRWMWCRLRFCGTRNTLSSSRRKDLICYLHIKQSAFLKHQSASIWWIIMLVSFMNLSPYYELKSIAKAFVVKIRTKRDYLLVLGKGETKLHYKFLKNRWILNLKMKETFIINISWFYSLKEHQ